MDVFGLDETIIRQYETFARSFTKIRSPELNEKINTIYGTKQFWPDPLVQLNPHYELGGSIQDFIRSGDLEPECADIFSDDNAEAGAEDASLKLYKHQQQAIGYALSKQSYVVTTGTGSGKSICYFVPIVDAIIKNRKAGQVPRTHAIIIYPMNALANSQAEELRRYLDGAKRYNPTFARYTGQESQEERERIRNEPPDILLTNFMMLELLMTRQQELDRKVLENCRGLRFVVLDELHTYRGRQGADVAMLMRRLRARIADPGLLPIYVGTSATMASEGDESDKNRAVSQIASKIFGASIGIDAVVTETLRRVTDATRSANHELPGLAGAVKSAQLGEVGRGRTNNDLARDDLAIWIETQVGLKNVDSKPERAVPVSLEHAAELLAKKCGHTLDACKAALKNALIGLGTPELQRGVEGGKNAPLFAFKLHQFISGAGWMYATLHPEGQRHVTASGQVFNPQNPEERLYPTHFCRNCGQEFHPVTLRHRRDGETFVKRDIDDIPDDNSDEDQERVDWGFLMPEPADPDFSFTGADSDYPESWLEDTKQGEKRLKYTYRKRRAQLYPVTPDGKCGAGRRTWFMPGKFRFCPFCKDVSSTGARDINKLASLTGEGRSSATTILIAGILTWMNDNASEMPEHTRKLLAFTDNRQDAALQAGHFNDFIFVVLLRGAILAALKSIPHGSIPEPEMGTGIQAALGFLADRAFEHRAREWMENPGLKGWAREDAEAVLRKALQHRFWIDQRRGWRYTNPNLEQLGLIRAEYQYLDDLAGDAEEFASSAILAPASKDQRRDALQVLFDHMRLGLAVNTSALDRNRVETLTQTMRGQIKAPWALEDENTTAGSVLMLDPPKRANIGPRDEDRLLRGTPNSALAKKIRAIGFNGRLISSAEVSGVLELLLRAARNYGIVAEVPSPFEAMGWQLITKTIQYRLQERERDADSANRFFSGLYSSVSEALALEAAPLFGFEGREHTAQVESDLRELREFRFRYEQDDREKLATEMKETLQEYRESDRFLPVMFCSPTMELGVDISSMNVVYLRNAPPTAANYAQRSGRAGRSGQPALIVTYCAAQSPHDQYFFDRKEDLVGGIVLPPSIDLRNQELVESHLHAEWLAASEVQLEPKIPANLDITVEERLLLPHLSETFESAETENKARPPLEQVLSVLEGDFAGNSPSWYTGREAFKTELIKRAPSRFNAAFDRWRGLLASAERTVNLASQVLDDYTISPQERRAADNRLAMGNSQRRALLESAARQNNDFYLYRYLATEGFLPGYNFPRLPLMAYVPAGTDDKSQRFIQRARFLAILEFGPQSLIYHEGRAFRVDRALLREAGDRSDGMLTTKSVTICNGCGAGHPGEPPENCHVCRARFGGAIVVHNLYQIENVGTHRADRITSNDEYRRRQGFDVQTTFSFEETGLTSRKTINDSEGPVATLDFAQAASISRINKGLRRRKDKDRIGFSINPKSGAWIGERKTPENGNRPEALRQLVVPFVEDRKNALLLRFPELWLAQLGDKKTTTLTTIQNALARGIEAVYQLEEGEILAEPTPDANSRKAILFYEAAEGGAGVLTQLADGSDGPMRISKKALEVMHYDAASFAAAWQDPSRLLESGKVECVAGCYRCLLSYFNQPDHEYIDRRDVSALSFLLRLAHLEAQDHLIEAVPTQGPYRMPTPDPKPLVINGATFPNVWRHARLVVVEEGEANDEVVDALASKGVKLLERPRDAARLESFQAEFDNLLKGRSHGGS